MCNGFAARGRDSEKPGKAASQALPAKPDTVAGYLTQLFLPTIRLTKTDNQINERPTIMLTKKGKARGSVPYFASKTMHTMLHQKRRRRGFTLVEITIAFSIFTLMTLACAAVFPVAMRAGHAGGSYAQAALIAQHKIDQCRQQGYSSIYGGSGAVVAKLSSVGIVDAGSGHANPAGYPAGSVSYTFTAADDFPTSNLPPGTTGTLVVGPLNTGTTPAWTPVGQIVQATVVIAWPAGVQAAGGFTAHTLIINQ